MNTEKTLSLGGGRRWYLRYPCQVDLELQGPAQLVLGPGPAGAQRHRHVHHVPVVAGHHFVARPALQVHRVQRQHGPVQFDDVLGRVPVVDLDGQVDQVVDAQAQLAEPVHRVGPPEPRAVPPVALEQRPAADRGDQVQQRAAAASVDPALVRARAVQPPGRGRVPRFRRRRPGVRLQHPAHPVHQRVVHRAVRGPRRPVVVHPGVPREPAARELVKVVARPHRRVHVGQHGRRGRHAALGHADVVRVTVAVAGHGVHGGRSFPRRDQRQYRHRDYSRRRQRPYFIHGSRRRVGGSRETISRQLMVVVHKRNDETRVENADNIANYNTLLQIVT